MREDLTTYGTIKDDHGYEIARLSPVGGLVIDLQDMFMYIYNTSRAMNTTNLHGSLLFKRYGRAASWRRDQYVVDAMNALKELNVLKVDDLGDHSVIVSTSVLPKKALDIIPKYVTAMEALGGLEEINE